MDEVSWWQIVLLVGLIFGLVWEVRGYRKIERTKYGTVNSSRPVREGPKKSAPEGESSVEYGGHHLP
jgi:hypothetical protein